MAHIKDLIETNIVVIYPTLDLRTIDVNNIGKIGDLEKDTYGNTFLVGNKGIKLVMPQKKMEIEIVENKLKIADLLGKEPKDSKVIGKYLVSVSNLLSPYKSNIYGFNFVVDIEMDEDKKLIEEKLLNIIEGASVKAQDISMKLQKDETFYTIRLTKQLKNTYRLFFNQELNGSAEDKEKVQENFHEAFNLMKEVVDEL